MPEATRLPQMLAKHESAVLDRWLQEQQAAGAFRTGMIDEREVRDQSREFLAALRRALQDGGASDTAGAAYAPVREALARLTRSRVQQGFSPIQVATFVFSLKPPLFDILRDEFGTDAQRLADEIVVTSRLVDALGLYTTDVYQKSREEVIARQAEDMLELSTPVVKLWEGVLAVPLIGTLDSRRTQVVMETLLQRIVEVGAEVAIIDITGVPTVDTLTAQHLIKTITAARLMGADCIISGIRPQIAQTIVHLGVDLADVVTKASLADAFAHALRRAGSTLSRPRPA
ncbi:MAG TPA: STAS domain-containing protein [Gemmatimonadaceae bacterium]